MRKICIEGQKTVKAPAISRPELSWIPVSRIVINDDYQRPLGKSNWKAIRTIAENFDWSMFTPVMVSLCDEGYALIDGQHRVHAAALIRLKEVPAMIVDLPSEGQARAFSWINGSATKISNFHIYKAALAAKEDWAIRSREAVTSAGCTLMEYNKSNSSKKSGEIFSIALIKEMINFGHDQAVHDGLAALRAIDRTDTRVALYSGDLLRPWLTAVAASKYVDLVPVLDDEDPYRVFSRAERESQGVSGSKRAIYRTAFVEKISLLGGHRGKRRAA